jgi:DNA-binding response OmpR family regulator
MTGINILLISEDFVFGSIVYRFLLNSFSKVTVIRCESFAEVRNVDYKEKIDIVLLDNTIMGAANYEIISLLRLEKSILAPVFFFSNIDVDKEKAFQNGANFFFKKPLVPDQLIKQIESSINKKRQTN